MEPFENNEQPIGQPESEQPVNTAPDPAPEQVCEESIPAADAHEEASSYVDRDLPFADSPYAVNQPQQPRKKKKGSGKVLKTTIAAVLALAIVAGSCAATAGIVNRNWENRTAQLENTFNEKLSKLQKQVDSNPGNGISVSGSPVSSVEGGLTPAQVYAQNVKSVVAISNQTTKNAYGQIAQTSGSGFVLTEDGYIVTNCHVAEGAAKLTVITYDGTEYDATLIGSDETNDIALLKIDASGLPAVKLGSSGNLIVGDQVVAIGNPLGELTNTLTVGYVSALDRDVSTEGELINMLQTDAAINPGNSGGPLFNMKGEVVGITTAKYSGTTSSGASIEGIGFAIPIDDAKPLISDLKDFGFVTGAYLGVSVTNVEEATARRFNLPLGAYVESVTDGSCADKAGIQAKDTITALAGEKVDSITSLTRALRSHKAGETVTITVFRAGQELNLTATLDEKPRDAQPEPEQPQESIPTPDNYEDWYNQFIAPFFGN